MAKKYLVLGCPIEEGCSDIYMDIVDSREQAGEYLGMWGEDSIYVYEIDPKFLGQYTMGPVFTTEKKGK